MHRASTFLRSSSVYKPRQSHLRCRLNRRAFTTYLVTPRDFMQEFVNSIPLLSGKPEPASRVVPVCAAWFMPNDEGGRTGLKSYKEAHIPLARWFDIDFVKDDDSPYPHMLPSAAKFASACYQLGIKREDTLVVYDTQELGIFSAPRVAWTFKAFGHEKVHILNNFREYVRQGFPTVSGHFAQHLDAAPKTTYQLDRGVKARRVADFNYMEKLAQGEKPGGVVIDARAKGRFDGTAPEPRPRLASGHMPNSINLPFTDLLDPQTKAFLPADKLRSVLLGAGVDQQWPLVSSCGTGVTAAIVDTALAEAGYPDKQRLLYDGSWTEWAMRVKPDSDMIIKPAASSSSNTTFRERALSD